MYPKAEFQIYKEVKSILKVYPAESIYYVFDESIKIRESGYESRRSGNNTRSNSGLYIDDSIRRTRTLISDLVKCNEFEYFATFTFKTDRQDVDKCKKRMSQWLKDQQKQYGKFQYLVVPEFHKDGKSLHFHGLLKNYRGNLKYSGKMQRGRKIYNLVGYRNGHTTAVQIDNQAKVSSYIRKYITKDMPIFDGKKRYWRSKGLVLPVKIHNPSFAQEDLTEVYKLKHLTVYKKSNTITPPTIKKGDTRGKLTPTIKRAKFRRHTGYSKRRSADIYPERR